jgi:hypothetical protein
LGKYEGARISFIGLRGGCIMRIPFYDKYFRMPYELAESEKNKYIRNRMQTGYLFKFVSLDDKDNGYSAAI